MSTNLGTAAFAHVAELHPHHAVRISAHNSDLKPGALAVITVEQAWTGVRHVPVTDVGTGFTGIHVGDTVVITESHTYKGHTSRSASRIGLDAATLSLNGAHLLSPVDPSEWTREQALAAKKAAENAATAKLEEALMHATGWTRYDHVAADGQTRAMLALQDAHDLRHYAFAVGVLANTIQRW